MLLDRRLCNCFVIINMILYSIEIAVLHADSDTSMHSDSITYRIVIDNLHDEYFQLLLKNGKSIKAKIIQVTKDGLVVEIKGGKSKSEYKWKDIEKIQKGTTSVRCTIGYAIALFGIGLLQFFVIGLRGG